MWLQLMFTDEPVVSSICKVGPATEQCGDAGRGVDGDDRDLVQTYRFDVFERSNPTHMQAGFGDGQPRLYFFRGHRVVVEGEEDRASMVFRMEPCPTSRCVYTCTDRTPAA
jgi:hypothetical protein